MRGRKKTTRRVHRRTHVRRQTIRTAHRKTFDALRVAQDILDHNRVIVVYGDKVGIMQEGKRETVYTPDESTLIIKEFHEMFNIAKRCTLMCDPLRKKLQELLFVCQPIGLSHARMKETRHTSSNRYHYE